MSKVDCAGFSLIEVLIAVLIVSLSVMGALKLSGNTTQGIESVKKRTDAYYVAMNIVNQQLYQKQIGRSLIQQGKTIEGVTSWSWHTRVRKLSQHISTISVSVASPGSNQLIKQATVQVLDAS